MVKRSVFYTVSFWLISLAVSAQAPPQLQQPENNSRDLPTSITFSWSPVSGADTYQIQISESPGFSTTVYDNNTSSTSVNLSFFSRETQYYWRVRAGERTLTLITYGDWSEVWNFTTIENPPASPEPVSPANGATDVPTNPVFEWSEVASADTYRVQVSQNQDFSAIIVDSSGLSTTEVEISGLNHLTQYFWRVRANNTGGSSDWSGSIRFTTVEEPPTVPEPVSPADGSNNRPTQLTLEWNPAERTDTYHLQLSENQEFSNLVYDRSDLSETSFQVTGLNKTTTYFWRIQAINSGGDSGWSQVWSFQTVDAAPSPPMLVSPDNGATGVTITPTLDWDPAERADGYDFQIATDPDFSNPLINQNSVTSTQYQAQLDGYTIYYWRVRAENEDGTSDWSETWSFTTEKSGSAIVISDPEPGTIWKAGRAYTIRWSATNNIEEVNLDYRISGSSVEWISIEERVNASSGVFDWTIPNQGSLEVSIRLSDSEDPGTATISQPFVIYPSSYTLNHMFGFGSGSNTTDYQLVALPTGNGAVDKSEVFDGEPGSDWRLFEDNGQPQNYLVEHTDSASFNLNGGLGYWAISRNEAEITKTVSSVELEDDSLYSIPLHEGWNIISNPFIIPVSWQAVQNTNGLSAPLWGFEGNYTRSDRMEVYKGYYFFNDNSLDRLIIPYPTAADRFKTKTDTRQPDTENGLTLSLRAENEVASNIEIEHRPAADTGSANLFQFAPPAPFQEYRITMDASGTSHPEYPLYKQTLGQIDDVSEVDLVLDAIPGRQIQLEISGQQVFSPFALTLIDLATGKSWNLNQTDRVLLKPGKGQTRYKLLIGNSEEVDHRIRQNQPSVVSMSQNYPNPFSRQTVIEYSIPSQMERVDVELEVFDILGRRIRTLVDEQKQPGFYTVEWDTGMGSNKLLSSGVYFYRLRTGQTVITKKLTIIN